jgi:hypothetical protein
MTVAIADVAAGDGADIQREGGPVALILPTTSIVSQTSDTTFPESARRTWGFGQPTRRQ